MAHHHHHHHHHSHDHGHAHDGPPAVEAPLDAANQSLADALRASFNVLKLIMIVLIALFMISGVQCIDDAEEAVVLRFGRLLSDKRGPGPSLALPYPFDETLRVPVKRDNTIKIDDHFIFLTEEEESLPLSSIGRGGLDPVKDGALLTSDNGLVHVRWRLVYRVEDLIGFVRRVADSGTEDAEKLIKAVLDNAAIHVASEYTAEEITRNKSGEVAGRVKSMLNQQLDKLGTGIRVVSLDIPESTVPIPTRQAFQQVSSAENEKQKKIREAEQRRDQILNATAGAAYPVILEAIEAAEKTRAGGEAASGDVADAALGDLVEARAAGDAQAAIYQAKAYYTTAVQGMQAAEEEYNSLLAEYLRAPKLQKARLWEETKRRIFASPEVQKIQVPPEQRLIRIDTGIDPNQRQLDEIRRLREEAEQTGNP